MYKVILKLDKFFLKYEGIGGGGGEGGFKLIPHPPGKTTFKKPSLIRVNEFLVILNKKTGFFIKSFPGFREQYHIFKLWRLFATFKSLKFIEFPTEAVVRNLNSKHFHSNALSFQITLQLQLHCNYITIVFCEKWRIYRGKDHYSNYIAVTITL